MLTGVLGSYGLVSSGTVTANIKLDGGKHEAVNHNQSKIC